MITQVNGSLLNVQNGILCHQVNCKGVMGAGIAKKIRDKWPVVYQVYRQAYETGHLRLGKVIPVQIEPNLIVANLCGQDTYGRTGTHTNYQAVQMCLRIVQKMSENSGLNVYIPKGMGCTLAGGIWRVVLSIIDAETPNAIIVNYTQ